MADGTREYSLLGRDGEQAVTSGLAGARWYQTDIPRKHLAEQMLRRVGPALRVTVSLFAAMVGLAAAAAPVSLFCLLYTSPSPRDRH